MDLFEIGRMFFALLAVVAMIGIAAFTARRLGLAANGGAMARKRRLHLVESLTIDARRRAVIIGCDGREHLVILGAQSETLVAADLATAPLDTQLRPLHLNFRRDAAAAEAA